MDLSNKIKKELRTKAKPEKLEILSHFFRTGKGQYAEGDKMLAVNVPDQREVAKKYYLVVTFDDIEKLLASPYHEDRLTGLLILTYQMEKADKQQQKKIVDFYLAHLNRVNNWDLVDLSAYKILGKYLLDKPRDILYRLSRSKHLWSERVAMVTTFEFIRNNQFEDTLKLAEKYLNHEHDLIHKATGWMLREVGKRDEKVLRKFLDEYVKQMPNIMYRYAIEKIDYKKPA